MASNSSGTVQFSKHGEFLRSQIWYLKLRRDVGLLLTRYHIPCMAKGATLLAAGTPTNVSWREIGAANTRLWLDTAVVGSRSRSSSSCNPHHPVLASLTNRLPCKVGRSGAPLEETPGPRGGVAAAAAAEDDHRLMWQDHRTACIF